MKILISFLMVLLSSFSFATENLDRLIERDVQNFEQENRINERNLKNSEILNFSSEEIEKLNKNILNEEKMNTLKYRISKIEISDSENLLNDLLEEKIVKKYINKDLNSNDLENLLSELTNQLISKGYVTSYAKISDNSDVLAGLLKIDFVVGRVENIVFNDETNLDKLKKFFMFPLENGDVLDNTKIDTAVENFNSLSANNVSVDIVEGTKPNYWIIKVNNEMKEKFTLSLNTNNYGEDYQNAFWRGGISLNIDSPLGVGDNLFFSYMTVHKKNPDRSWKQSSDTLPAGGILPIGPPGYDPSKGDVLPYKRQLDMYNFRYILRYKDYNFKFSTSKSVKDSSFYAFNTIYDMQSINNTVGFDIEKIIWRNKQSKLSIEAGIKTKHNENYLEEATLINRRLSIASIGLNYTTAIKKGILSLEFQYEKGLKNFGAEIDKNKIDKTPKAQFKKYNFSAMYYKPLTHNLISRTNIQASYSSDVLYSSERQTIGGIGSVPGYHRSDNLMGDKAIDIGTELAYNIKIPKNLGTLSPYLSYSYGAIENNRDKSKYGTGYATGIQIGTRYSAKYLDIDFGYGRAHKHSSYLKPKNHEIYFATSLKVKF